MSDTAKRLAEIWQRASDAGFDLTHTQARKMAKALADDARALIALVTEQAAEIADLEQLAADFQAASMRLREALAPEARRRCLHDYDDGVQADCPEYQAVNPEWTPERWCLPCRARAALRGAGKEGE